MRILSRISRIREAAFSVSQSSSWLSRRRTTSVISHLKDRRHTTEEFQNGIYWPVLRAAHNKRRHWSTSVLTAADWLNMLTHSIITSPKFSSRNSERNSCLLALTIKTEPTPPEGKTERKPARQRSLSWTGSGKTGHCWLWLPRFRIQKVASGYRLPRYTWQWKSDKITRPVSQYDSAMDLQLDLTSTLP